MRLRVVAALLLAVLLLPVSVVSAQETPTPYPLQHDPTVVDRPDASTCVPGSMTEEPPGFLKSSARCADGVAVYVDAVMTSDHQHLISLREDWALPGHKYAVTCIYPTGDQTGPPASLGPPTCTDVG